MAEHPHVHEREQSYLTALSNAPFGTVSPYLQTVCPECSHPIRPDDAEHAMIGPNVVIGCDGFLMVDPNLLGIHAPQWIDWRPDFTRSAVESTLKEFTNTWASHVYAPKHLLAHAITAGHIQLDECDRITLIDAIMTERYPTHCLAEQIDLGDWEMALSVLRDIADGDYGYLDHPHHNTGNPPLLLSESVLNRGGTTITQMRGAYGGDVHAAATAFARLFPLPRAERL